MGASDASVAGASAARPTPPLGAPAARQRDLLRPMHRLYLALSPARVSTLANGVYDMPPVAQGVWQRVHEALRRSVRRWAGRDPEPSATIMDSQSVKTTEESGLIQGYDEGKQVKGRKRHLLVDTLGLLLSVYVTPANPSDQERARRLLIGLKPLHPRLERIWADSAYGGEPLATWCAAESPWRVEIITCTPLVQGFVVRPWCWIVERTLGWIGRQRRFPPDVVSERFEAQRTEEQPPDRGDEQILV